MSITMAVEQAQANLTEVIKDAVSENREIILTQQGESLAVIMSLEDYKGWKATLEEMQDPESLEALERAEQDEKAGRLHSYKEVFGV